MSTEPTSTWRDPLHPRRHPLLPLPLRRAPKENNAFEKKLERIDSLYEEIEEKRGLGETKEAAKLQRELDGLRDELTKADARRASMEAAVRGQQVTVFNQLLSQIEMVVPALVEDHEDFDQELVKDLEETVRGYEKNGDNMVEALKKASRRILRYDPSARGKAAYLKGFDGKIPTEAAEKKPEPEKKLEPKKTDIKKNIDATKKQPVDPKDDTSDVEAKLDIKKLSPEAYKALPASTRAKMRGDFMG